MLTTLLIQGIILSLLALGTWLTFRVMDFPDLTVDGSFLLGASATAVGLSQGMGSGWSLFLGLLIGATTGGATGLIHSKGGLHPLLSGIVVMIASYSLALRLMGKANIALMNTPRLFSESSGTLILMVLVTLSLVCISGLLKTRFGLMLRLVGDNPQMISSLNRPIGRYQIAGLMIANGLAGVSGGLMACYQGFADLGMGSGMVIVGLVSVILGEAIGKRVTRMPVVMCCLAGAIGYRAIIAAALELGLAPGDLRALTAVLLLMVVWKKNGRLADWLQRSVNRV